MNIDLDKELEIRYAAFQAIESLIQKYQDNIPHKEFQQGFPFNGEKVSYLSQQGIFKPRQLALPLSLTSTPRSQYKDAITDSGDIIYKYRGTDPDHRDNVGLRKLMEYRLPFIYFHGIIPAKYVPTFPCFIVQDDPNNLQVTIAVDQVNALLENQNHLQVADQEEAYRRRYATRATVVRLHQATFRERVLRAYNDSCALCRLKHVNLLDAAHIIPDSQQGEPVVSNGMAMCKIHHAAFDQNIIGIRPDLIVEVRTDILREVDGPMLKYGIQSMHHQKIIVPGGRDKPNPISLEQRFEQFRAA